MNDAEHDVIPGSDETATPPPHPGRPAGGLSVLTVAVASLSSVAAALVGRQVWGPGTLAGAAATPVVVMVVAELLQRPARRLTVPAVPHVAVHVSRHRGRLAVASVAGLVCFVIGAALLTGYELVLKGSSVGSSSDETTLFTRSPRATRTAPGTSEPQPSTPGNSSTTTAPADPASTSSDPTATSVPATPSTPTATSVPSTPSTTGPPPATPAP